MAGQIIMLLFPLMMFFAATSDLMTMRISNRLVFIIVICFVVAATVTGMSMSDFGLHFAAAAAVLAGGFTLFVLGWVGGGDAKLAAATTLWLGFGATVPYLLYGAILGGALTLLILVVRRFPLPGKLQSVDWIDRLHNPKTGIPYGIALAISGVLTYAQTDIFVLLAT